MVRVQKKSLFNGAILLIALQLCQLAAAHEDFSYADEDNWVQKFPQCGGKRQSPINVESSDLVNFDGEFMIFDSFEKQPVGMNLTNVGHTIKLSYAWNGTPPSVRGGKLSGEYLFDSIHFHWSRVSDKGSEHLENSYRSAIEMHVYFYKAEYGSYDNAMNYDDGYTAISCLFKNSADFERAQESPGFTKIIPYFSDVSNPGESVKIDKPFILVEFKQFPINQGLYHVYEGSHSTPPCKENVLWLVNTYEYFINSTSLEALQSQINLAHDDDHNFRDTQQLNGRQIYKIGGDFH